MAKARCNYAPVVFDAFTETAFCFRQSNSLTRFHWVDKQARDNANLLVAFRSALFPKQNSGSNYNSARQREQKNFRVGSRHSRQALVGCARMTPKIRLSPDVVGSERVCLTGQRSIPMFIEKSLAGFLTMGLWLTSRSCKHY